VRLGRLSLYVDASLMAPSAYGGETITSDLR
jgi:hypothetical protein